jgi:hypothetical protein
MSAQPDGDRRGFTPVMSEILGGRQSFEPQQRKRSVAGAHRSNGLIQRERPQIHATDGWDVCFIQNGFARLPAAGTPLPRQRGRCVAIR